VQQRRGALCSAHLGIGRGWLLRLGRANDQFAAELMLQARMGAKRDIASIRARSWNCW
jgi:hypothetical protein